MKFLRKSVEMENIRLLKKKLMLLTQKEFIDLLQLQEKKSIIHILISGLLRRFKNMNNILQYDDGLIKDMIFNTKEIIYSRKQHVYWNENPGEDIIDKKSIVTFDLLPRVLLSHISSYLLFTDILLFEQLNVNTFLASRLQNTSQHLDAGLFMKCLKFSNKNNGCTYNWYRFRNLESLSINCRDIVKYYHNCGYFGSVETGNFALLSKLPIWKKLTTLQILHPDRDQLFRNQLLSAVQRVEGNLSNIQYLDILSLTYQVSTFTSLSFWGTLKGVGMSFVACAEKEIISKISTRDLECFHGSLHVLRELYNQNKTQMLKELCLCQEAGDGAFLQWERFRKLQRVVISAYHVQYIEDFKSIVLVPDIEYVSITKCYGSQWQCIIGKLCEGLRNCKKSKLMLNIEIYGCINSYDICLKDFNQLIFIMNQNIRDFVLSIVIGDNCIKKVVNYINSDDDNGYHVNEIGGCIDIVSKNSKIYGKSIMSDWCMKCFFCSGDTSNGCFPLSFYS